MLKYRGHRFTDSGTCGCCVGDERVVSIDPTGTKSLRSAFNSTLAIKWRGMRVLVREAIISMDLLSLGSKGLMNVANPAVQGSATKIQMFQRWLDNALNAALLGGDGSFMRPFIERGYYAGQSFAQAETNALFASRFAQDRQAALHAMAVSELQGIMEAVSQQAVRIVASGLLHAHRPAKIVSAIQLAIDKVGITRSTALVELIVVKAFSEATLDVYEASGVTHVGLLPEELAVKRVGDAKAKPKRRNAVNPNKGRSGSRSRKATGPLSPSTIARIEAEEAELERKAGGLVKVRTAGDKRVCAVCRAIAKKGPYKINVARGLIPAHPRCRCVFIPVAKRRRSPAAKADNASITGALQ